MAGARIAVLAIAVAQVANQQSGGGANRSTDDRTFCRTVDCSARRGAECRTRANIRSVVVQPARAAVQIIANASFFIVFCPG